MNITNIWPFNKPKGQGLTIPEGIALTPSIPREKPENHPNKFTNQERIEIVQKIAHYWTSGEIQKWSKEKFNKDISKALLQSYKDGKKWQPLIQHYREEYDKAVLDVPLANKRKRLDELQKLFEKSMEKGNLQRAQSVIKDFKEEMEERRGGDSFFFTNISETRNEYNTLSDEDLARLKLKEIENLKRVRQVTRRDDLAKLPIINPEEEIDAAYDEGDKD